MNLSTSITAAAILSLPLALHAQNDLKTTISPNPSGWSMDWDGVTGDTYFMQFSTDLVDWTFFPTIRSGDGSAISHGFSTTADKFFTRVKWTDLPDGGDPNTADFDKDGLSSLEELLSPNQTDPLNNDTDGDRLFDGWEVRYGLLPNNSDTDGNGTTDDLEDNDGDGADNFTEQSQEGDPNDPIDGGQPPLEVVGWGDQGVEVTNPNPPYQYQIPAGSKSYLVVAYVHSEEYVGGFTATQSEFDDVLRWDINPSNGDAMTGTVSVNTLHDKWVQSEADGTSFLGYSPIAAKVLGIVHSSAVGTVTVDVEIGITNIADGDYWSTAMIKLEPVNLFDINDEANNADDTQIANWDTEEVIGANSVAWIDAHTSPQNAAPRMPQLVLSMPDLPEGTEIEAKLEVDYTRGNGLKPHEDQDLVKIPANGFKNVEDGVWNIYDDYPQEFFGGVATLTFKVDGGDEQTIKFKICGENPDNTRCRDYIISVSGVHDDYAYVMAKSESRIGNALYNQFRSDAGAATKPHWHNDSPNLPGGYGIGQLSGEPGDEDAIINREQIWNWQKNADGFIAFLNSKRNEVTAFLANERALAQADGNANDIPNIKLPRAERDAAPNTIRDNAGTYYSSTFNNGQGATRSNGSEDGQVNVTLTNANVLDFMTMKAYNGAGAHAPGHDTGTGHYCVYRTPDDDWEFRRRKSVAAAQPNFWHITYVTRVTEEYEDVTQPSPGD